MLQVLGKVGCSVVGVRRVWDASGRGLRRSRRGREAPNCRAQPAAAATGGRREG